MTSYAKHVKSAKTVTVHSIPSKIGADEQININPYFTPKITSTNSGETLTTSLRGFPCNGKVITLPEDYSGMVLNLEETSGSVKNRKCSGKFDKFTFWNWDRIPSENDPLLAALNWMEISGAIHS